MKYSVRKVEKMKMIRAATGRPYNFNSLRQLEHSRVKLIVLASGGY